ncbi:MFS transporter [Actinokineospora sp. 24-640]
MGYRSVVAAPRWGFWAGATLGARLPVAMAPLALMLTGYHVGGGAAVGGALVAGHTLGEVVAASSAGAAMDRFSPRRGLAVSLAAEAVLFALFAVLVASGSGPVWLVAVAVLAGAVAAGAPGGLRAALTGIVPAGGLARALAVDSVLNQTSWVAAPLAVGGLAALVSTPAALVLLAVTPAVGAACALGLPRGGRVRERSRHDRLGPLLRLLARPLALTALWRLAFGILTIAVVPMLGEVAPVALAVFAVGTICGSVAYSGRTWPWRPEQHADLAVLFLGAVLALTPLLSGPVALVALYGVAGLLEGPAALGRSLQLERVLPPERRSTGFSLQYAAIGIGFGAAGLVPAQFITVVPPGVVVALTGAVIALGAVVALATDRPTPPAAARWSRG